MMLRFILILCLVYISILPASAVTLCQPGAYYSNSPSCRAGQAVAASQQQIVTPPIAAILGPAISQDDIGHILSSHYRDIPLDSYTDVESLGSEQLQIIFTAPTFVGLVKKLLPIAKLADKSLATELQTIINYNAELITNRNGQMYVRYILSCGGSLVAKDKVLTAAHCIYDLDNEDVVHGTYPIDQDNQYKRVVIGNDWTNTANKAYALAPVTVKNAAPGYVEGMQITPENDFAIGVGLGDD